jgi:hypothetical protein
VAFDYRLITKTMESPCRECDDVEKDKEVCSPDCDKLKGFQESLLEIQEQRIRWFSGKRYAA